jgi:hypothetical protein
MANVSGLYSGQWRAKASASARKASVYLYFRSPLHGLFERTGHLERRFASWSGATGSCGGQDLVSTLSSRLPGHEENWPTPAT